MRWLARALVALSLVTATSTPAAGADGSGPGAAAGAPAEVPLPRAVEPRVSNAGGASTAAAVTAALDRCVHDATSADQAACLAALRTRAEARLQDATGATRSNLAHLDPQATDALESANEAWAHLRDADCALARDYAGQPGHALPPELAYAWCMAEHTMNRANYVDAHLRRPSASAAESARIRSVRTEAQRHRQAVAAAEAAGTPPPPHACRYESAISTAPPEHVVALTFDDGPEEGETEYVLDTLQRHQVRAAFFLIGEKAHQHPELVARLVAAGHLVLANHSWSHPNFHDISAEAQAQEVARGGAELDALLGQAPSPRLFRYPYGNSSCATNDLLHAQGYRIVGWHVDSCDWAFDLTGSVNRDDAQICEVEPAYQHDFVGHVVSQVERRKGGIVLMHEIHPHTLHHLDTLLTRLEALGYTFGSIDDPRFESSLR